MGKMIYTDRSKSTSYIEVCCISQGHVKDFALQPTTTRYQTQNCHHILPSHVVKPERWR
jgi:hypothetical protein